MRVYRPPTFNLMCSVWLNELPDDLHTWDGLVPSRTPDLEYQCQLYFPRWSYGDWKHAYSDKAPETLLRTATTELRLPKDADVKAPWGVSSVSKWSEVPLVEVPGGSGRLYVAILQDIRHCNFPNEYVVCLLGQIGAIPASPPPPPPPTPAKLGMGSTLRADSSTGSTARSLPAGSALYSDVGNPIGADLPPGSAFARTETDGASLPAGGALAALGAPTKWLADLPTGNALIVAETLPTDFAGSLGTGSQTTRQELLPTRAGDVATGHAVGASTDPPKAGSSLGSGSALTADVPDNVYVNPCATAGTPRRILCTCTAQSGSISGWVGLTVTVTYTGMGTDWTGTLTKGGHSGTVTFHGNPAANANFSGFSGTDWNIGGLISGFSVTCGPPWSASGAGFNTNEGLNVGTTDWSFAPAP